MKRTYFIWFFLWMQWCFSQNSFFFYHYTTDDGLPTNTIYSVREDREGNYVIGTDNGLSIYAYNYFKNYNTEDGLLNPYVTNVDVGSDGKVYFACYKKGIQIFDKGHFRTMVESDYYFSVLKVKNDRMYTLNRTSESLIKCIILK